MKKAFTLLELLIVIIIIGVLASIAVPQFLTAVERGRIAKAKNALGLIAQAEKMYRADLDTYIALTHTTAADWTPLNAYIELNAVEADTDWTYGVAVIAGGGTGGAADTFIITATKNTGQSHGGETITLNQFGVCGPRGANTTGHSLRGKACGAI